MEHGLMFQWTPTTYRFHSHGSTAGKKSTIWQVSSCLKQDENCSGTFKSRGATTILSTCTYQLLHMSAFEYFLPYQLTKTAKLMVTEYPEYTFLVTGMFRYACPSKLAHQVNWQSMGMTVFWSIGPSNKIMLSLGSTSLQN